MREYARAGTNAYDCLYVHTCMYEYVYVYECTYDACVGARRRPCAGLSVCLFVCLSVCLYICTWVSQI